MDLVTQFALAPRSGQPFSANTWVCAEPQSRAACLARSRILTSIFRVDDPVEAFVGHRGDAFADCARADNAADR